MQRAKSRSRSRGQSEVQSHQSQSSRRPGAWPPASELTATQRITFLDIKCHVLRERLEKVEQEVAALRAEYNSAAFERTSNLSAEE